MSDDRVLLTYDPTLDRPGCVLLAAALGGDMRATQRFPSESWLLAPTDDMRTFRATPEQVDALVARVSRTYTPESSDV